MYEMNYDKSRNVFSIVVEGQFKEEEGLNFIQDYKNNLNKFNPRNSHLSIDSTNLKTSFPNMKEIMANCFNLYMSSGFKDIFIIQPSSVIATQQIVKIANECGLKYTFINSISEIR